jgi:hypothetical protein
MAGDFNSKLDSPAARKLGTAAGGIGGVIFAVIWISFSSVFVAIGIGTAWKSVSQSAWLRVPCVIDDFQILDDPNQDDPFSAKVTFRYQAGGRERSGHHLYPPKPPAAKTARQSDAADFEDAASGGARAADYQKLARLQQQYLTDPSPVCLVDPDDPGHAALMVKREDLWGSLAFGGFGLCFVGIGVGILLQSIRQTRGARGSAAVTGGSRRSNDFPLLIGVPFFGLFAASGCGLFCFLSVPILKNAVVSPAWVATPATVIWSRIASHSDSDGTTYKADVFYRYSFGGKEYKSNRGELSDMSSSGHAGKERVVRANPPGTAIVCYVNPHQPWEAVRNRSLGWSALLALFPLPFMAVGLGGLWYLLRRKKSTQAGALTGNPSQNLTSGPGRTVGDGADAFTGDFTADAMSAGVQLTPGKGRLSRLFGMVLAAVFWNGIVSVFLWHVASEWRAGHTPWFLTLFLTPFVCVGVGLLVAVMHALGALLNPRPLVTLVPGQPQLGQSLTIDWQIPTGADRLASLRIVLRGEEVATYRRGTTTATDRAVFYEAVFFESTQPLMMAMGRVSIIPPANLMPSWKADNNRIEWSLHLDGGIRLWPDLADSHVLTVRPAA